MQRRGSPYAWRVGALTAAALVGRLLFLGYQPLWRDEAFTAVVLQRGLGSTLDAVRADSGAPLLYLLDHLVAPFSTSTAALRVVPAVAGAAAVPLVAALARRIAGDRAGLAGAALAAVAPALVLSARDARMYALATTLVLLSTALLLRAVERPAAAARWVAYAAATALALYTDYFAALAVLGQLAALAFVLRGGARRLGAALLAAAAAGLLLVPWLIAARAQFSHAGEFWVPPLSFTWVGGALVQLFTGPPLNDWVPGKPLLVAAQAVAVLVSLGTVAVLVARRRSLSAAGRRALWYCVTCAGVALALLIVISAFRPLITASYASVVWGPLFAVLGAALAALNGRRLIVAAIALTCAVSIALSATATHPDTSGAVQLIKARLGPDDIVDAHPSQYLLLLRYADSSILQRTVVVSSHVAWFWGTAAYPPGAVTRTVPASVIANHGNILFVSQPGETPENLPSGYRAVQTACVTGSCVTTYARPA